MWLAWDRSDQGSWGDSHGPSSSRQRPSGAIEAVAVSPLFPHGRLQSPPKRYCRQRRKQGAFALSMTKMVDRNQCRGRIASAVALNLKGRWLQRTCLDLRYSSTFLANAPAACTASLSSCSETPKRSFQYATW